MADDTSDADAAADGPIPYRPVADISVATGGETTETRFFLKTAAGKVFAFGEHEHFLWKSLDGRASFADLERAFATRFGLKLTPRELSGFIAYGMRCGLLERSGKTTDGFNSDFDLAATQQPKRQTGHRPGHRPPQRRGRAHVTPYGSEPWTIIIGNPTRLFAFLGTVFGPLRYVKWFVFPAALVATMILLKHLPQFQSDWRKITTSIPWWPFMYSWEHTLNIIARITEGTILQANGGAVRYFGVRFLMGVVLRGFIDEHDARSLPEHVRLWSKAGVLLIRLGLFALAAFAWIALRQTHPLTAQAALFISVISFILFCINACPLIPAEGYELMAACVNQSRLALRAFRFIGIRLRGADAPASMSGSETTGLTLFGIGTFLTTTYVLSKIIMDMGSFLTGLLRGLGYLLMMVVFVCAVMYIRKVIRYNVKGSATLKALSAAARAGKIGNPSSG